ncbi:hypothetical protein [Pelagicoccus mobilis]|uniref:Uncharacterized protein n=1 Tax=Pelagicoccus mobilis TaxID=415221 RepID=A0A934S1P9_9BACT|nr:hypothetical protein [Pelagicoccus mobilis]MBK1877824.1 hypothetical protein [Pelagicoccus mobilis]
MLKKAPRVEIPEAYDKRKRKRPKRHFGAREFSRSINIAIVGGALICIALLVFFFNSHKNSGISPHNSETEQRAVQSLQARQEVWQRFADAGYPRAQLESARATAAFLANAGEDTPSQIIAFLDTLNSADDQTLAAGIPVPKHLIQKNADSHALPLTAISYPAIRKLALLPAPLLKSWSLGPQTQNAEPTSPSPLSPIALLPAVSYSPQALSDSLDAYQLQADSTLQSLPPATLRSLDSYFVQKSDILENAQFAPILQIHQVFKQGPQHAFIGFDEQERLIPGSPMSLGRYLNELMANLLQQSDDLALQSSTFRQPLTLASQQDSALEVASAIHQAFATLDLSARPNTDQILRIRTLWEATFIRSDLMEQTILGYTLEAIEAAKLELTQTRSQFSQRDLALYLESQARETQIDALKQAASMANSSKDWIVISKQSPKLRRSQP